MKAKFEIWFTPRFSRRLKALDKEAQVRILRGIHVLKTNPYAGKPLRGEWKSVHSLRIGNYRVLYRIKGNKIHLLVVGHRKRIYEG